MAAGNPVIADLIRINDENLSGGIADELLQAAPLVARISSLLASNGNKHDWLRYDDPPPADFRDVFTGRATGFGNFTAESRDCKIVDASTLVDAAYADAFKGGRAAYVQRQAQLSLRSSFQKVERQLINGTAGSPFSDAAGFLGIANDHGTIGARTVSAGGTTNLTSVYIIRSADPMDTAALVLGNDGNITIGNAREQAVDPAGNGQVYNGIWVPIHSWYAYQGASTFSTYRIANVDSQAGTPVVNDDILGTAIASFPTDRPATHIVYNRSSWAQHRASRTATNAVGSEAPFPIDAYGLPIVVTDQIDNNETQVV